MWYEKFLGSSANARQGVLKGFKVGLELAYTFPVIPLMVIIFFSFIFGLCIFGAIKKSKTF